MKEKKLILTARVLSMVFTPLYLSLVGIIALFTLSYLNQLPTAYKLTVLTLVYIFTILLPTVQIRFYRNYHGWTLIQLSNKERRIVPYLISVTSYMVCSYIMQRLNFPHFISSILIAALMIQCVCTIINVFWKISTHTAAIGGVTGALMAFAFFFGFNPIGWLCIVLLLAGMVGTSRIILRQHTLAQVTVGFIVGVICAFPIILFW